MRDPSDGLTCAERYGASITPLEPPCKYRIRVAGQDLFRGTPYEGGAFVWDVTFRADHPFKPPSVRLRTPIYHVNWSDDGSDCFSIFQDQWSPGLNICKWMRSVLSLFTDANPEDPLRPAVAVQYKTDRAAFDAIARDWYAPTQPLSIGCVTRCSSPFHAGHRSTQWTRRATCSYGKKSASCVSSFPG